MDAYNVLIIGDINAKSLLLIKNSKYLNKLYTNFEYPNTAEVKFNTFRELAKKCKALKIDMVIVEDSKLIFQGIVDVLKKNFINCIGLTAFWTNLILSNKFKSEMTSKYQINTPERFLYPKEFPLFVKADGFSKIANSMDEVISFKQELFNFSPVIAKSIFLEKFIEGNKYILTSLYDGKTLITLPNQDLPKEKISEYNDKLFKMFRSENANFIGHINSSVIFSNNQLYNIGFNLDFPKTNSDIIFIFNSMIYQKLDELDIFVI